MGAVIEAFPYTGLPHPSEFSAKVAEVIGGNISPDRVQSLIDISNDKGFVFHGIRLASKLPFIQAEGILPLTPEGGRVSFWTIGEPLFGWLKYSNDLSTFDTTFFHYAPSSIQDNGPRSMNIAVSQLEILGLEMMEKSVNAQLKTHKIVPSSEIMLAQAQGDREPNRSVLNSNQVQMFELLEYIVGGGFEPGTTIRSLK